MFHLKGEKGERGFCSKRNRSITIWSQVYFQSTIISINLYYWIESDFEWLKLYPLMYSESTMISRNISFRIESNFERPKLYLLQTYADALLLIFNILWYTNQRNFVYPCVKKMVLLCLKYWGKCIKKLCMLCKVWEMILCKEDKALFYPMKWKIDKDGGFTTLLFSKWKSASISKCAVAKSSPWFFVFGYRRRDLNC